MNSSGFDWENEDLHDFDLMTSMSSINDPASSLNNNQNAGANPNPGDKKKISDAHIYGPRFCAIYEQYRQKQTAPIDISRHLMSLCVDHMISFIKWARESEQQVNMISSILLENDYLRPEVRNGVVMVLIYTFASMKATILDNMDMFSTLQDPENGLGIANKFSLKIYNDPFNYLIFLKLSISALIDAGVIPDNERQNQPKKGNGATAPSTSEVTKGGSGGNAGNKVHYTNREELDAYHFIANKLVGLLDANKNTEARNFVHQIVNFWQLRGKYVRNRKFTSAVQALSQPGLLSTNPLEMLSGGASVITVASASSIGSDSMNVLTPSLDSSASANNSASKKAGNRKRSLPGATTSSAPINNNNLNNASSDSEDHSLLPSAKRSALTSIPSHESLEYAIPLTHTLSGPVAPLLPAGVMTVASVPNMPVVSAISTSPIAAATSSSSSPPAPLPLSTLLTQSIPPLHILRFERIGVTQWDIQENKVFDLTSFLHLFNPTLHPSSAGAAGVVTASPAASQVFLVNETLLTSAIQAKHFTTSSSPLSPPTPSSSSSSQDLHLLNLMQSIKPAIITSWLQPQDYLALQSFLVTYVNQQQQIPPPSSSSSLSSSSSSLFRVWQGDHPTAATPSSSSSSSSSSPCLGYLAYEIDMYVILLLRKNPLLGLVEDIWCRMYPTELSLSAISSDADQLTIGEYLMHFFPQLTQMKKRLAILSKKHAEQTGGLDYDGNDIMLKYYQHKTTAASPSPVSGGKTSSGSNNEVEGNVLPAQLPVASYQTIGTYATPAKKVIARLSSGALVVHDFVLELVEY